VITEPFAPKSRREAEALGMADLPLLVLPHPVGQLPHEAMRRLADQSFAEIEFILTATPEDVATAYQNRTTPRSFPAR
jgi:predicted dienelactone hydrolase